MAVEELPEELITIILSKLPVKSLLRFKCVCKSWYFFIKSPNFIDLHLTNSNHRCLIIRRLIEQQHHLNRHEHHLNRHVLSFYSYETLIDLGIEINTPFTSNFDSFYVPGVSVSGPCNGLICITNNNDRIIICNPATREFRSLFIPPSFGYKSGYHFDSVAFGLDPDSCEYKVVMIGVHYDNSDHYDPGQEEFYNNPISPPSYRGDREAVVYDFSNNSWRETGIILPEPFGYSRKSITFNGAFHWWPSEIGDDSILSFIISDEVTESIPLPEFYSWEHESRYKDLFVLNKSLALIVYDWNECFEISVMTEYGVKDSWARLLQLGPLAGIYFPLAFWNSNGDEKLLLESDNRQLVSCDFQHQNFKHFPIYGFPSPDLQSASFDVFMYSESLVSVNGIGGSA